MVLLMQTIFARRIDVTRPDVSDIGVAESNDGQPCVDEDGIPRMLRIFLWKSKGEPGPCIFSVIRNFRDVRLCPVFWLQFYISVANLQSGPLFPHFSTDGTSTGQRMTKENVSADFSITMIATFGAEGAERRTTHTPRGTAAKLAAILNAPDTEVKRAGRWASEVYHIYVNEGRLEVLRNRLLNNFDKTLKRVYWFPIR